MPYESFSNWQFYVALCLLAEYWWVTIPVAAVLLGVMGGREE